MSFPEQSISNVPNGWWSKGEFIHGWYVTTNMKYQGAISGFTSRHPSYYAYYLPKGIEKIKGSVTFKKLNKNTYAVSFLEQPESVETGISQIETAINEFFWATNRQWEWF